MRVVGFMCDVHVCISERIVGLYVLCASYNICGHTAIGDCIILYTLLVLLSC